MQIFYEHNVKGVYAEGAYYVENCDVEFAELRAYMLSKCLQDPYCDLDHEIDGFLAAYYGPGSGSMRKIIDLFTKYAGAEDGGMWVYYTTWACMRKISPATAAYIDILWKQAKKGADGEQLAHIERSELSWRCWKACAAMGEFSYFRPCRFDAKEQLLADLIAADVTMLSEGRKDDLSELDRDLIRYATPDDWVYDCRTSELTQKRIRIEKMVEKCPLLAFIAFILNIKMSENNTR